MILDTIALFAKERVEKDKKEISEETMRDLAYQAASLEEKKFPFERMLGQPGIHFICEVKKASPSKGVIAEEFPYLSIAKEYEAAGAGAVSVLTEPKYFLGSDLYLREIAEQISIPVLRKDFTVDPYQIYQAKVLGAKAVLLICALLPRDILKEYRNICDELGLSALVEAHDEQEIEMAVKAGARIIGINNRDLKTFVVDIHNSERLRKQVPDSILFVAESGIRTAADVEVLCNANVNGILIGETLMCSKDKKSTLRMLRGENP